MEKFILCAVSQSIRKDEPEKNPWTRHFQHPYAEQLLQFHRQTPHPLSLLPVDEEILE